MLFASLEFLIGFLPGVLLLYVLLQKLGRFRTSVCLLVVASLVFYAWWKPPHLFILCGSIIFNFLCGLLLMRRRNKALLIFGIVANILLLGYFKYTLFILDILQSLGVMSSHSLSIVLPLGISFFTFTQIAYLIDAYRGLVREHNFMDYCLFVSFFPHLLAGPIVHHAQLMPQFRPESATSSVSRDIAIGATILIIGLFKKVILADSIRAYSDLIFQAADAGKTLGMADAWMGAFAYSFQLYFDFSGYSDMAIGMAKMMGILLPINFNAPYRSHSIREFWSRWHMTLSRFLQDYLYIPLGGSRKGEWRTLLNLFLTMLLAGVWHGAGWTFVMWGGLHGAYLVIHRVWLSVTKKYALLRHPTKLVRPLAIPLTFLAVTVSWVFFRANDLSAASEMLQSMMGLHGVTFSLHTSLLSTAFAWKRCLQLLAILTAITWLAPTTQQFIGNHLPADIYKKDDDTFALRIRWKPTALFAIFSSVFALTAITVLFLAQEHVFLYFQF